MRWIKSNALSLIVGVALLSGAQSVNAQLVSSTGETLVNTAVTDSTQQNCAISMDTLGRYVVVWESEGQDGDGFGIYAKIFNADHSVRVSDFLINTSDQTNDQRFPDVAMNAEGTFCVVWQSTEDEGYIPFFSDWYHQGWDCYRKLYDIDGTSLAPRSRVNSSTAGNQMHPAVAAGDNYFSVVYMSEVAGQNESEIQGRILLSNGAWTSAPIVYHTATGEHLAHPDVAMAPNDDYAITWQADGTDGDRKGVYTSLYDNSNTLLSGPTQVNTTTTGNQQEPRIAIDENGEYMIVWSSFNQDGDHYGIYGQRFDNSGTASGGEIAITTNTSGSQDHAAIAVTREGSKYVISWTDDTAEGDRTAVYSRLMYSNGTFLANDAIINTTTTDFQSFSDVAIGTDATQAMYAWQSGIRDGATSQTDPSYYGIYSQGFVVADTTSPIANCQNVTIYLDATGNATITATDIDAGSTDNIGITSMTLNTSSFTCADIGSNPVILTVFDAIGNSDACGAFVTVADTTSPTAACQDVTVYLDGSGNATITTGDINNGSSDNCTTITLATSQTAFTCADVGANPVALTVTDGSGNISTCTSTVTIADTSSPSASCQNITVYLDGTGNASITASDIDGGSTDNCSLTLSASQTTFTCGDIGANSVTLTATDPGSNIATCTATVTVVDSTSPTASCQNITVYLDGTGNASITAGDIDNGSADNCGSPTLGLDITAFTCADIGANSVTLTVTDGSSNISTCTSTVTVVDSTSPAASCQNVTVYLDGTGSASISTGDIDNGSTDNCTSVSLGLDITAFTCADIGTNTVMLTVTDGSSNISTCTSTVTVSDSTSPTASCQDVTVYLDGSGNASITTGDIDNGSADNCAAVSLSASQTAFTCANIGTNSVTLTVTDGSGNISTCTSTVTVSDSTSPTASCQDVTVYLDGTGNASITAGDIDNGSTDNCSAVTLSASQTAFDCSMIGANTVILTVTDGSGNVSTCTSAVTVSDTVAPVVLCQAVSVQLDASGNATLVTIDIGSSDNCGIASMAMSQTAFTCADLGANTVTLTVTDNSGNTSTCSAIVTVLDNINPTASCQDLTAYIDGTGNATITAAEIDNGSADNCSTVTLGASQTVFTCAEIGANTVTLTVTDGSGNISTCTATVTVADSTSPTASCQDVTVYLDGSGSASITTGELDDGSTDNCSVVTLGVSQTAFSCADIGANTVTLTVTDGSGNMSSCTATVTVMDTIVPVLTACPADIILPADEAGCVASPIWIAPMAGDNCGATLTSTHFSGNTFQLGTTIVTYTAVDASGNSISCSFNVTVTSDLSLSATSIAETVGGDGSIDLTVTGSAPGGYTYAWSNSAITEDLFGLVGNTTYSVVVTNAIGCTDTLDVFVDSYVGIGDVENDGELEIVVYPNPTVDGDFSIQLNGKWNGEVKIDMVDSRGRLIYSTVTSEEIVSVKIEGLLLGTYFIRAKDEKDNVLTTRLVKVTK
jgi:hypothetical protein